MKASERFTPAAAEVLRRAIEDARGNEVFASGRLDDGGLVSELQVAARGHVSAVPAIVAAMDRGDILVHNHPSGRLVPSEADLGVASLAGDKGLGFYIVDSTVAEVYVVAEPARRRALRALDPNDIAAVLEPGGKLASKLSAYEPREAQIELVRRVVRAFNSGGVLAAEAGTGVGKSYAYLLAAFAWAARNEERVVVSTATINLQRQLADKDIPAVAALFKKKLKAAVAKGRGNYLCRTRLAEALDEEGIFLEKDGQLASIAAWAKESPTGDKADLPFLPEDATWSRVKSESETCFGLRCPMRETCFFLRARRELADADLIVANHHILFADLAIRSDGMGYEDAAILPPFRAIVFDEAHAVESSATSYFSDELARFDVYRTLGRLLRVKRDRKFGLVPKLQNLKGIPPKILADFPEAVGACRRAAEALDEAVLGFLGKEKSLRLTEPTREVATLLFPPLQELERSCAVLVQFLSDTLEAIGDEGEESLEVKEARLVSRTLAKTAALCARFRRLDEEPETVFWLERGGTSGGEAFARLVATPLEIGPLMAEKVYEPFRTVVFTSATLAVGGSFGHWAARVGIGLSDSRFETVLLPSPFPYRENALLVLARDAPSPDSPEYRPWVDATVASIVEASGGHALLLFTSYDALRSAYEASKPVLERLGVAALRQGADERSRLLDRFKAEASSVLFATDSFWEGVDAPGDACKVVVMAKLPFRVPTDPVQKARSDAIEKRGGNAFMELSLPEAVVRFKQGFGRLIRHSEDRGVVVVLDSRVLGKRYGSLFVESLPPVRVEPASAPEMPGIVARFLGR